MATPRTAANQRQRTWRTQGVQPEQRARRRRVFRLLLPLIGICLLGLLAWMIVQWYLRVPRLQLVAIRVADYGNPEVPTIPYCFEDIEALRKVLETEDSPASTWTDAESEGFAPLGSALDEKSSSRDNLLVYIKAHGVSINGEAYLLDVDFALGNSNVGRRNIRDVLDYVAKSPARLKLVALDTGHMESDPQMGMLTNAFTHLLHDAVAAMPEKSNVWVLTSNSLFERALVSHKDRRSAFAFYMAEGLKGRADGVLAKKDPNKAEDRLIQLDELFAFMRDHVVQYARLTSDFQQAQTPMLLRAGKGEIADPPHEILRRVEDPLPGDAQENAKKGDEQQVAGSQKVKFDPRSAAPFSRERPLTQPLAHGRFASLLMRGAGGLALAGNQAPGDAAKEDPGKASPMQPAAAPPAQESEKKATASADKEAKSDAKDNSQSAKDDVKSKAEQAAAPAKENNSATPAKPTPTTQEPARSPDEAKLFNAEKWFYEQQNSAEWRPADYAPGLSRLYYESLAGCRDRSLAGDLFINSQYFQRSLNRKLSQLEALRGAVQARRKTFQAGVARPTYERDDVIHTAIQVRNEACHQLPLLIKHYAIVTSGAEPTIQLDLQRLVDATAQLDLLLAYDPAPQQANELQAFADWKQKVASQAAQAKGQLDRLKADFEDRYAKHKDLIAGRGNVNVARRLADLAQSPLATPERREELNRAARSEKIARSFAEIESQGPSLPPSDAEQKQLANQGWAGVVSRAELELALAAIALVDKDAKWTAAQQALAAVNKTSDVNNRYIELRKIDEFLYGAYRRAPQRAMERLKSKDYADARAAETAIRLADARDQSGIDKVLGDRVLLDPICDLRLRALPELTAKFDIALQSPAISSGALPLHFGVGEKLTVRFSSNATLPDRLRFRLKYDPARLRVKDAQGAVLGSDVPREFTRAPGGGNATTDYRMDLQLESLDERGEQSSFSFSWLDENDREQVKQAIQIAHPLPVLAKLAVFGSRYTADHNWQTANGAWYFDDVPFVEGIAQVRLRPFTGHETRYDFRLTNSAAIRKDYSVEVRSVPAISDSGPRPSLAAMVNAAKERGAVLARNTMSIEPGRFQSIRFDSPPPVAAKDAAANATKAPADKPAAEKTPPPDVTSGLVCFLTDVTKSAPGGQSTASRTQAILIEPKVQPPQYYVTPKIVYKDGEIAAVLGVPEDVNRLPIDGARVQLEVFSDQLKNDSRAKYVTTLTRQNRNGDTLYAFVRGGIPAQAQVALHVDDYPRAFIYEFSLDASLQDVVRKLDLNEIKLPNEAAFPVYLEGKVREPLRFPFRVDLPPNSDRSYRVRVFLSATADAEYDAGTLMLEKSADREHRIEFIKVEDAPALALRASTADLQAMLNLDAYENQALYVRVQLVGPRRGEETVLADKSVRIYLDGIAPTVTIDPPARAVYEKTPFSLKLYPQDDISGIKQVEFALAKKPNPDPKAADKEILVDPQSKGIRVVGGAYQLTHVFEKPDLQTIYVQATDMRGNKSEIAEREISVQKMPTVNDKGVDVPIAKLGKITGRASLPPGVGGRVDAVILRDAGGGEYAQTKPADNGSYSFDNVPPGKYSVEAKGTIAGNFSKPAPKSVTVEAGKTSSLDVLLSR